MISNLSITSRSQGQIFGAKPSMEEFERQLETDPVYQAYSKMGGLLEVLLAPIRFANASPTRSHSDFIATIRPNYHRSAR